MLVDNCQRRQARGSMIWSEREKPFGKDSTYEEGQHPGSSRSSVQLVCVIFKQRVVKQVQQTSIVGRKSVVIDLPETRKYTST